MLHATLCDGCEVYLQQIRETARIVGTLTRRHCRRRPATSCWRPSRAGSDQAATAAVTPTVAIKVPETTFDNLLIVLVVALLAPLLLGLVPRLRGDRCAPGRLLSLSTSPPTR